MLLLLQARVAGLAVSVAADVGESALTVVPGEESVAVEARPMAWTARMMKMAVPPTGDADAGSHDDADAVHQAGKGRLAAGRDRPG